MREHMDKTKILVIDDEQAFLDLLQEQLGLEGYGVITARDGEEGLQRARSENPDLVICDLKMPRKNGYEVLKEIRKGSCRYIPVIIVTVIDDYQNVKEAYKDEADFYISKPVKLAELSRHIRTLLSLQRLEKLDGGEGRTDAHPL